MAGGCQCPQIDLADWRDRQVTLAGQAFLTCPTPLFLHLPHRLHQDLESLCARAEQARLQIPGSPLVLHRDGWFRGEVLVSIEPQPAGGAEIRSFQTLFYSRVVGRPGFDAALRAMPGFYGDLRRARVGPIQAMYFWYVNCPACLLEKGARQIVLLAQSRRLLASDACPAAVSGQWAAARG